jgi:hypothetical protein
MPLEITLKSFLTVDSLDRAGQSLGPLVVLAEFGPLVVTSTVGSHPNAKEYPFTITHRASGQAVNHFRLFDLCCCAARQWSQYDWTFPGYPHFPPDSQTQRAKVYAQMKDTAIFPFGLLR